MKYERGLALTVPGLVLALACSSSPGGPGAGANDAAPPTGSGGAGGTSGGTGGQAPPATGGSSGQTDVPPAGTGGAGGTASGMDAAAMDAPSAGGWPAVTDYAAHGPFPTQRDTNTGPGNGYDVFRPTELGAGGRKHPIISWNNGTLYAIDQYKALLDHLASYGFVVIGAHTNTTAGGMVHKAGIDWLVVQNANAQTPYFGKLDVTKIGASGHSQGGGATLAAAANKPGVTGIVASLPLMPILSFESDTSIIGKQTAPLLIVSATMDDRSSAVADQTLAAIKSEYVNAQFKGVHEDAMNAAMHAPALAWFRFRLMDDQTARAFFYPPSTCGLCKDAAWMMVRYKNTP